jgi:hypothetical protein
VTHRVCARCGVNGRRLGVSAARHGVRGHAGGRGFLLGPLTRLGAALSPSTWSIGPRSVIP